MTQATVERLQYLCGIISPLLESIQEEKFRAKPAPHKWSKKEILGHLIDSANNNHQRFVRIQFEDEPLITYDQDKWNNASHYNNIDSKHLIAFWNLYNQHLVELIKQIPDELLIRKCNVGDDDNVTLLWLIEDYLKHLEHHLRQIVEYD